MLHLDHIHRPSLERYVRQTYSTLMHTDIIHGKNENSFIIKQLHVPFSEVNIHQHPEIFEHKVNIENGQFWFNKAGCGRDSWSYATNHNHTCLICAEVETQSGSCRKFTSFHDNDAFIKSKSTERHLYECIRPGVPCMLFTDHDQHGGVEYITSHENGVRDISLLFDLLGIPPQEPIVLTSHRKKGNNDYLSTHLRFPTVSLECIETLKFIHHLLKHTGKTFGGLDFTVNKSYQQLRLPFSSKVNKTGKPVKLLPTNYTGSLQSMMVGNSHLRDVHITTEKVKEILKSKFGCCGGCNLSKEKEDSIDAVECEHVTRQIHSLYLERTGKDPSSIRYLKGNMWFLGHSKACIHGEVHKSNNMYIYIKNKQVYCQCHGRCNTVHSPVLLGSLLSNLSITKFPWEKLPKSCHRALVVIGIVRYLVPGIDPEKLSMILACIGDFKTLLDAYLGMDSDSIWTAAINNLKEGQLLTTSEALKALSDLRGNPYGKSKKRKVCELLTESRFDFPFDFYRFKQEHPGKLEINNHNVSSQLVHSRFIEYNELDLSRRVILLKSEMATGKTSNCIIKMIDSMPHATVIALTPRRLFSSSLRGVFKKHGHEFSHYEDEGFFKQRPKHVIIEIESLWKLKHYNFKPYDFLIIDESETTLTQMLSVDTHKHNLKNNWDTLIWLLENANKVLLADARMSAISMEFVKDHVMYEDIHYIHNTYKIPMKVNFFLTKAAMEEDLKKSMDRNETMYTFSGSRVNAFHLQDITSKQYGPENSVIYSSTNSQTKKVKDELSDVNNVWCSKMAIHTTPSITVGTSFDVPDVIQNIYLFPVSVTAGPKDVVQASRRIRHPINNTLNCVVSGPQKKVMTDVKKIKDFLSNKSRLQLEVEKLRVAKDFEGDEKRMKLVSELLLSEEKSSLVKTGLRVIQERQLQLRNYTEELTRTFLDMGHDVHIVRNDSEYKQPKAMMPEERVFTTYNGATGIMAHYDENEEVLEQKEKAEELTEDEQALVKMVHYLKNFDPEKWPILGYEYWLDYNYKLQKDKRLHMILNGNESDAQDKLNRSNRYTIARAEGDKVDEHLGILHTTTVPEFNRISFYAFAKPLFKLLELLEMTRDNFTTDSIVIKLKKPEITSILQDCQVLLGMESAHIIVTEHSTYKQLLHFLIQMVQKLIDGTFSKTSVKKVSVAGLVKRKDRASKSRKKQEKIMSYSIGFDAQKNTKGTAYSALERVSHLAKIE